MRFNPSFSARAGIGGSALHYGERNVTALNHRDSLISSRMSLMPEDRSTGKPVERI